MFDLAISNTKRVTNRESYEEKRKNFNNCLKKGLGSFYGIAIPDGKTKSGIFYAPHGRYQMIDYLLAYSSNGIKVMQGRTEGKIWTQEDMQEAAQNEDFMEVQINLQKKNEGICIENEEWVLNPEKDSDEWIYILFQVVSNVSLQQISKFIIYYDASCINSNGKINYIRLESDGYNLLRSALSRMATEGGLV